MLYCVYGLPSAGEATDVPGMEISTGGAMARPMSVVFSLKVGVIARFV